jgi:hypothetical protein
MPNTEKRITSDVFRIRGNPSLPVVSAEKGIMFLLDFERYTIRYISRELFCQWVPLYRPLDKRNKERLIPLN